MRSEEQWEYIGKCADCGASCYAKDGEFKSTSDLPGCLCSVNGYGEDADREMIGDDVDFGSEDIGNKQEDEDENNN